jgi:hypothetical protein
MPRIVRSPGALKPQRHGSLVELLANELKTGKAYGQPRIEEEHFKTGAIRVDVLWDLWHGLSIEDRTNVIIEAYRSAEGEDFANRIALVNGWTFPEATATGMLPVKIFPAMRDDDPASPEQCHQAMIEEGASTLRGRDYLELRFATKDEADASRKRLIARLPASEPCWVIVVEPDLHEAIDWDFSGLEES